jgi:hypothetical protein
MLVLGAAIRLLVAPHIGFVYDLRWFPFWAERLRDVGVSNFYSPDVFSDYPPGYLYVLALLAQIDPSPGYLLLKTPIIVADLAVAWLASSVAMRVTPQRVTAKVPVRALAMLAVLLSPAVLGVGVMWGQVDVVPVVFVMAGVLLLVGTSRSVWRDAAALLWFAVAFGIKPQSAFLAPVVLYVLVHRYVLAVDGWKHRLRGASTAAAVVAPGAALWAVSGVPFGLSPVELFRFYVTSSKVHPFTGSFSFNFWGIFANQRGDAAPYGGQEAFSLLGLSARTAGLLLFTAGTLWCIVALHRALRRGGSLAINVVWASIAVSMLAFTFLTRMHQRYVFAAIVLAAPLIAVPRFRKWYLAVSVLFVANLWHTFTFFNNQWRSLNGDLPGLRILRFEPWFGWLFGDLATLNSPQRRVLSAIGVGLCLIVVFRGQRWVEAAEAGRADELEESQVRRRRALRGFLADGVSPRQPLIGLPKYRRSIAWAAVLLIVVRWLVSLRDQLRAARTLNDSTFHMQMVRWAEEQIRHGRIAFDGWFPDLTLGSAFFQNYQSLPFNLTAIVSRVMPADADQTFRWFLYLLLATWPIIIYASARILSFARATALAAAAISLLLTSVSGFGFEIGSYGFGGFGMYTQLFGMWVLPLAWATTWRALHNNGSLVWAATSVALTVAMHFMTGYLALISVGVIALAAPRGRVLIRGVAVLAGALLVASWVLVPLLQDRHYATVSEFYLNSFYTDSFGAGPIVRWLVSGSLFDEGRLPVITVLAAIGAVACAVQWRIDSRCRALLMLAAASLALFFGRATWGSLSSLLPGDGNLHTHRFVSGVHLSGILLAAVGASVLMRAAAHGVGVAVKPATDGTNQATGRPTAVWLAPITALALLAVLLAPALNERTQYVQRDGDYIDAQQVQDATDGADLDALLDVVAERNDGRVYAGTRANWGKDYRVGSVPVLQELSHRDLDALGFTFRTMASLSNDVEAYFDETNPAQFEMFNVRYMVLPDDRQPPVPATLLSSSGRHRLYEVTTAGYIDVVDRIGSVSADRSNLAARTGEFRTSQSALAGVYPGIAFDGRAAQADTFAGTPPQRPGSVISQSHRRRDGVFSAEVAMDRPGVVLAKTTYDPGWRAFVDGVERPTTFMAPSFVGVDVEAGTHEIRFEYHPYSLYPLWWAVAVATLVALWWVQRRQTATAARS